MGDGLRRVDSRSSALRAWAASACLYPCWISARQAPTGPRFPLRSSGHIVILLFCSFSNHCPKKSWGGGPLLLVFTVVPLLPIHPVVESKRRVERDSQLLADAGAGQPGHQLPGAARAHSEQCLDYLAAQVARVHAAENVENSWKSVKPCGIGRHRAGIRLYST